MNSRKMLAAEIRKALPTKKYRVLDAPRESDVPEAGHPVVMVIRTHVRPTRNPGSFISEFDIWVIEPKTIDPEDDLDDALDQVLLALEPLPWLSFDDAARTKYGEQPAYKISAITHTPKKGTS